MSVPFRRDVFGGSASVYVEAAFGANLANAPGTWAWTDITADVMYSPGLSGSLGRGDETSQSPPANLTFSLLNLVDKYSAYSPFSANFPFVVRNTPIRVRRDLGAGPVVEWQGRAVGWTPTWDVTGKLPIVAVVAAGRLRVLGQGKTPLQSPLARFTADQNPTFSWPMEEGPDATFCAPVTPNTGNMAVAGNSTVLPKFGITGPVGAAGGVELSANTTMYATFNPVPVGGGWRVNFMIKPVPTVNVISFPVIVGEAGSVRWMIVFANGSVFPSASIFRQTGTSLFSGVSSSIDGSLFDGNWHSVTVDFVQTGADIDCYLLIDDLSASALGFISAFPATTLGAPVDVTLNTPQPSPGVDPTPYDFSISNLSIVAPYVGTHVSIFAPALRGHAGENPTSRMIRLSQEQGVLFSHAGGLSDKPFMGPQLIDTYLANLRDCEKTDGGVLYDGFGDGLGYICRSARYNLAAGLTVDGGAAGGQLGNPFTPADDDQRVVNEFTASRSGGGSQTYSQPLGPLGTAAIDVYDSPATFNCFDDSLLLSQASWPVNLGTVDGLRYPQTSLNWVNAQASTLAATWLAIAASTRPISWRMDVTNVQTSALNHPPGTLKLIVEGYSFKSDLHSWTVTANTVPFRPWQVGVVGTTFVVDTAGSHLAAGAAIGAASLSVTTDIGPVWTTTATFPADFPLTVGIAGIPITVTAIVGAGPTQTLTVDPATVTKALPINAAVALWQPAVIAL